MRHLLLSFLLAVSSLAAAAPEGETVTFYLTDHLGSPVVATDEQGNLLWKREYSAFGQAKTNGDGVQVGYTGHEFVPESGLTYMGARWYHPELGRFLQPDPVGFVPSNSLSFNRYLYVNNNPYMHYDPDGEFFDLIVEVASITLGVSSAIQNFSQGNIKEGLYDVAGVVADGVLMAVPGVPGGVGATRHALKNSENIVDTAQTLARACSFAEGTLVATPNGWESIETLERGDQVLARSEAGDEMDYKRILDAYSHYHTDGLKLVVEQLDGTAETIITTQEHPFFVSGLGFFPAGELEAGWEVETADSIPLRILEVDLTPIQLQAYNYTVEDFPTYFVGASKLWVHNACDVTTLVAQSNKRAPKKGEPNSIWEQVDNNNKVMSRTYYDKNGHQFSRQDFNHEHGGLQPHEHRRSFDSDGRPITSEEVTNVSSGYTDDPTL